MPDHLPAGITRFISLPHPMTASTVVRGLDEKKLSKEKSIQEKNFSRPASAPSMIWLANPLYWQYLISLVLSNTYTMEYTFKEGHLTETQDLFLLAGFDRHSAEKSAPPYIKDRVNWLVGEEGDSFAAVLTADVYWDWMHIDELWVDESYRGRGIGKTLMQKAEEYAIAKNLSGLWLWTQSWQAPKFYEKLGYVEFTRFEDLPKGYTRIGYRKKV